MVNSTIYVVCVNQLSKMDTTVEHSLQDFQYFSSVPVLYYLQALLLWKFEQFSWISLKSEGTKDHFRLVKVHVTCPCWKAWVYERTHMISEMYIFFRHTVLIDLKLSIDVHSGWFCSEIVLLSCLLQSECFLNVGCKFEITTIPFCVIWFLNSSIVIYISRWLIQVHVKSLIHCIYYFQCEKKSHMYIFTWQKVENCDLKFWKLFSWSFMCFYVNYRQNL